MDHISNCNKTSRYNRVALLFAQVFYLPGPGHVAILDPKTYRIGSESQDAGFEKSKKVLSLMCTLLLFIKLPALDGRLSSGQVND